MYKSCSATQLKNRKGKPWQMVIQGTDVKKKTKMASGAKGKKEALAMARLWMEEMNEALEDNPTVKKGRTVSEVITARLDYRLNTGTMEKSTYRMYLNTFQNNVEPYIGGLVFTEVDRLDLEIWIKKLHDKGLKQNSIYNAYTVPKAVYSYYYKIGEIEKNPFTMISVPKGDKKQSHMTRAQMDSFLQAVYLEYEETDATYCALMLMYYGALRRGEVCGLRWSDINFETNTIFITSAIGVSEEGNYTKPPKNKSSIRSFPLIEPLKKCLLARYNKLNPPNSWFVCGEGEEFMTVSTLTHRLKKLAEAYNLTDIYGRKLSSHLLRHNVGMMGIKSQMDIASLSKMFGHASRSTTLNTYGDYSPDAAKVASDKLSNAFEEGSFFKDLWYFLHANTFLLTLANYNSIVLWFLKEREDIIYGIPEEISAD